MDDGIIESNPSKNYVSLSFGHEEHEEHGELVADILHFDLERIGFNLLIHNIFEISTLVFVAILTLAVKNLKNLVDISNDRVKLIEHKVNLPERKHFPEEIIEDITNTLEELRIKTNANSCLLMFYHNGEEYLNSYSYKKFTTVFERAEPGTILEWSKFHSVPTTLLKNHSGVKLYDHIVNPNTFVTMNCKKITDNDIFLQPEIYGYFRIEIESENVFDLKQGFVILLYTEKNWEGIKTSGEVVTNLIKTADILRKLL